MLTPALDKRFQKTLVWTR